MAHAGNTFTITQYMLMELMITFYNLTNYIHTPCTYIRQSGDGHLPSSSNGDGMIYLAQNNDFVIYTNLTQ